MFGRHVKSPRRPYWLFVILWLITLTLYLVLWIIDAWPYGAKLPPLLFPNVSTGASLQGLAEVTVAVLAMAITVTRIAFRAMENPRRFAVLPPRRPWK